MSTQPTTVDFLRSLLDASADVVLLLDEQLVVRWASPSVADLGWAEHELLGATTAGLVHPDDAGVRAQAIADAQTTGTGSGRARIRRKNGGFVWMSGRIRQLPEGGLVLSLRDIEAEMLARAEAEAALDELAGQEERLRAALDSMLDPHLLLESVWGEHGELVDLRYVEVNHAAARYMGKQPHEVVGRRMSDVFSGAGVETLRAWCREALSTQAPLILDDVTMTSSLDGLQRRMDVRAVPVDGRVSLTWRDQTQRHREAERISAELLRARTDAYDWINRYRLLADHGRDAIVRLHRGVVEWASDSLMTTFGIAPEAWEGQRFLDVVHGIRAPADAAFGPVPQLEVVGPGRAWLRDGDGLPRLVEVVAHRYPHGLTVASLTDLTRAATQAGVAASWLRELGEPQPSPERSAPEDETLRAGTRIVIAVLHIEGLASIDAQLGPQALDESWRELRRRLVAVGVPTNALEHHAAELVVVLPRTPEDPHGRVAAAAWVDAVATPIGTGVGVTRCRLFVGLAERGDDEQVDACTRRAIAALATGVAGRQAVTLAPTTD